MMSKPDITLEAWAKLHYNPSPSIRTLRKWASAGHIQPQPQKVGRTYMVNPDARYIKSHAQVVMIPASAVSSGPLSERASRIFHGQESNSG